MRKFELGQRSAGLLLHVTSLPGPHGNGDLGPEARAFIDFLASAGQSWWQMLPVNPAGEGHSPYSGASAFAGSPLLINLEDLVEEGLLDRRDAAFRIPPRRANYVESSRLRAAALRSAFQRFRRHSGRYARPFSSFCSRSSFWLPDYALYMAIREATEGMPWPAWPPGLAKRRELELARARRELAAQIAYHEFEQFVFDRQWSRLRAYGRARGVGLIGDAPIFVAHESADVWAHARLFTLDVAGNPTYVAGVPPDYFSKTGQRWGNPLYRWSVIRRTGFRWWVERFRTLLEHFDVVRLDHFIGFSRYWQVPAAEKTAERGRWKRAPGGELFDSARKRIGSIPFIAEDLGEVTSAVRRLRDDLGLPGMRVLQFAFGNDLQANDFLPHAYVPRAVAYTGTHDNDTFVGWFSDKGSRGGPRSAAQAAKERRAAIAYFAGPGARKLASEPHWEAIRALYASVAATVIVPMQDVLGLDNGSRMNVPGRAEGNWEWRVDARQLSASVCQRLREFAAAYARLTPQPRQPRGPNTTGGSRQSSGKRRSARGTARGEGA